MRALDAAADRLFQETRDSGQAPPADGETPVEAAVAVTEDELDPTPAQRRADALGLLAEAALSADLDPGATGDRYQVVVHVEEDALRQDLTTGQAAIEDYAGLRVPAETSRRLACDASRVVIRHDAAGRSLDVGRKTRTVSPAIRRALNARDGRCRFPGCGHRRCDAHHVQHWADGGPTRLDNLILLCRSHHRAVHEQGFQVTMTTDGNVEFRRPDGRPLPDAPALPRWDGPPLAAVDARLQHLCVRIDSDTATPAWRGERLDLGWAIDVLWRPRTAPPPGTAPNLQRRGTYR